MRTPERRPEDYDVRIVGAPHAPLRDFYHLLLQLSWPATLAWIVLVYLGTNALFALGYLEVGGVEHARPGSFADAFFFSVQTMGTIGYGAMAPQSFGANVMVVAESVTSLLVTALATGLVFAKFSRPTARIIFTERAAISEMNGVPTLSFRLGNQRSNRIVDATLRVLLMRTEITKEGKTFYRQLDLKLSRERSLTLSRAWTALHVIDAESPLCGETAESLARKEAELLVQVSGTDDIWMQTVQASHRYLHSDLAWGMRLADILSEAGDAILLDLRKFHLLEPAPLAAKAEVDPNAG